MDLIGGQNSLSLTTTDKLVPNTAWLLLAVDEFTSWKWVWSILPKKSVRVLIRNFLQQPKTKFDKILKRLQKDSGTEFSNSELQRELFSRGIEWQKSSSHVPE
ncbi:hypothetical protein K3495_g990 [Podosphaera aphanis]|nr:hypothetical protein K3495_g990 [Podosphaera aphanis]